MVGIVVNPFSGKDLRRITSSAANVSNAEKANKVIRMISSMHHFGVNGVLLLPDNFDVNRQIAVTARQLFPHMDIRQLPFLPQDSYEDTLLGVDMMMERGISCLIVLGGDGTCRLAAKAGVDAPLIPISTGTNNVYPEFWEGTTAGIAAAYTALNGADSACCTRSKAIHVYLNGELEDIALVDAAITKLPYIGSAIIPDVSELSDVVVSKCSPELIGLSALVGCTAVCDDEDDFGYSVQLGDGERCTWAPMNSGRLDAIRHRKPRRLALGEKERYEPSFNGTVALDGERTFRFAAHDTIEIVLERNGPRKMDVKETLRKAVREGFLLSHSCDTLESP